MAKLQVYKNIWILSSAQAVTPAKITRPFKGSISTICARSVKPVNGHLSI